MIKTLSINIFLFLALGYNLAKASTTNTDTLGNYSITGRIRNYGNGWIYLSHGDGLKKARKIDSTRMENGLFNFSGKVAAMEPFLLGVHNKDSKGKILPSFVYQGPFFLSPGQLYIEGEFDWRSPLVASGNKAQDEYNIYIKKLKLVKNDSERIQVVKAHITEFPNSFVSAYIAKSSLVNASPDILRFAHNTLTEDVKKSVYGKALLQMLQSAESTAVGNTAPSFSIPDAAGRTVSLEAAKGDYTLIDFWASWCGPCRAENPRLIEAYNRYHTKGFKIISISMDTDKKLWLKAVAEDKLKWLQLSDLKGIQSETGKMYGITAIPMNFLIDRDGKIIARNLKGADLGKQLQKIFK